MKTLKYLAQIMFLVFVLLSCKKDSNDSQNVIQNLTGHAQKGPFLNGSSVTIYDLQSNLSPTGKTFNAQITDNQGTFTLNDIWLSSTYVSLRADGFYFNEFSGVQSATQITLYAISDISGKSIININILTHLEKARVEYLMKTGKSFSESKIQAQKEILAIFDINKSDSISSENLNISQSGDDNGILLAISAILQGHHTESELTELLSNISDDISTDGVLNNENLSSELTDHAIYIDTNLIKSNLLQRYNAIGGSPDIPDFGKHVADFISISTDSTIYYPTSGLWGKNIISTNDTAYYGNIFSLAAYLPKGASVKIKITALDNTGIWYYGGDFVSQGKPGIYNWSVSDFNFSYNSQIFTSTNSGTFCDMHLNNFAPGRYLIEYYESGSAIPTGDKIIKIKT